MNRTSEDFIRLLEPVYSDALKYCLALAKNNTEAKDLLQESLLKAISGFKSVRSEENFKSWLFTIITRECYALHRRRLAKMHFLNVVPHDVKELPDPFAKEIDDPMQKALLNAMKMLNEKERVAVLLFEVGEFSLEQIRVMQEENSISAIKSRISRARVKLRELILDTVTQIKK